ncbi:MAG: phosphoglucosamine mutase [Chloroflexi bacterium]|nr:phosphoglucosamine mutase [Chloroflexota bacterium]MDQ3407030.1 phosphoglucosamine mutase [Chloroflexota bacterium]
MPRLFGTDGIRGVANVDLRPTLAYALGRAAAVRLLDGRGAMVVGQDTRRSGDMLVAALVAGGTSAGADVHRLGVCPTPALALVAGSGAFGAGIMVSASHNPAEDNGLKVLDGRGLKLDDRDEDELEALIWRAEELASPPNAGIGQAVDAHHRLAAYVDHRLGLARAVSSRLRVALDCANGSGGSVAPRILAATGASVDVHFDQPDGTNINLACGATAPGALAALVRDDGADVGFCLDGDADRCVAIDERGEVVDGDQLIGIIALDRLARGALAESTVVVSILSNGGLVSAIEGAGGRVVRTPVGDKHIHDAMVVSGAGLGGEKSGHVIVMEHTRSGDGIVTALEVLSILSRSGLTLSELAARVPLFPQQQRTIAVRHKEGWEADRALADAVHAAETELAGRGRVVVRPSGTEPALRIMIEGDDAERVTALVDALGSLASERLN